MKGKVSGIDDYLIVSDLCIHNSDERYSVINGTHVKLHCRHDSVGIEYVVKNAIDMVRLGE